MQLKKWRCSSIADTRIKAIRETICKVFKKLVYEISYRRFILSNVRQTILYVLLIIVINGLIVLFNMESIIFNSVTVESAIPILELIAHIMGLITSLLMGYFFFAFQATVNSRSNWYNLLKAETTKLQHVIINLPNKLSYLKPYLTDVQELFNRRSLREYPIVGSDWKVVTDLENVIDKMNLNYSNLTTMDNIFDQAINIICNLEEYASELGIIEVRSFINKRLVNKIKKFFLLIASLVLVDFILRIMSAHLTKYLIFNILLFFIYFFIVMCLEIIFIINDYMRNVSEK